MAVRRNGKSNKGSKKTNVANTLLNGNLKGGNLELIVAALLVSGKLRVRSVTLLEKLVGRCWLGSINRYKISHHRIETNWCNFLMRWVTYDAR